MAFNNIKIVGDGTAKVAVTNTTVLESVVNSLVAYNTTGSGANFSLLIGGVEVVKELVAANDNFRIPDKLNIPANTILTVNADTGVTVTVSYFQQAIDVAAALSSVQQSVTDAQQSVTDAQQSVTDASTQADRAEGALPAGTIDDLTPAADKAYSSTKIVAELATKMATTGGNFTGGVGEKHNAITSTSNATAIDCSTGNVFAHVLTENTTVSFSNVPTTGTAFGVTLKIVQDASASGFTFTWPISVNWVAATAPTLTATASAVDVITLFTHDGGTIWYGFVAGQGLA